MDTNPYFEMFIDESKEHLQSCNEHLLELEKIRRTSQLSMKYFGLHIR